MNQNTLGSHQRIFTIPPRVFWSLRKPTTKKEGTAARAAAGIVRTGSKKLKDRFVVSH